MVRTFLVRLCVGVLVMFSLAGCVPLALVAVGAGAVGGYAVSRDTFEGVSSRGQDELWEATNTVLSIMGEIKDSDRKSGSILAVVSGARITVTIIPVSLTATKLRVKARKSIFPRVATAQEVYSKIMRQLE